MEENVKIIYVKITFLKNYIIKVLVILCLTPPLYIFSKMWFFHRYRFHFVTKALFRTEPKKRGEICNLSTSMMLHTKTPLDWRHGPDVGVPVWDNSIDRKFVRRDG